MRRSVVLVLALAFVFAATPAYAATVRAKAGDVATRWDIDYWSGEYCGVGVDDYDDHDVEMFCVSGSTGRVWVKFRVRDVVGDVTKVRAVGDGACSGKHVTYRQRDSTVSVKVIHTGEFDCIYSRIVVRSTG